MKLPCKPKYVDEAVPDWMVVQSSWGPNQWHVIDSNTAEVFSNLTKEQAEKVVELQQEFKAKLHEYMDIKGPYETK